MKDHTNINPAFSEIIKILETTDPEHADLINIPIKQLLQNTLVLKKLVDAQQLVIDSCPEDVTAALETTKEEVIDEIYEKTATSYADLMANTVAGYFVDAVAIKAGFEELNARIDALEAKLGDQVRYSVDGSTLIITPIADEEEPGEGDE